MATEHAHLWSKLIQVDDCWIFTGRLDPDRYGLTTTHGCGRRAHRLAYELMVGPIPDGLTLCGHRACVNPDHLDPVPSGVNVLRGQTRAAANRAKTHCDHGHELAGANLIVTTERNGSAGRACRECGRRRARDYQARHRAA